MNQRQRAIAKLCDGERTSKEIATLCGDLRKYVQKTMVQFDLPRRARGSAVGNLNGSWLGGRRLDRDGYVLTSAPADHPHARYVEGRPTGRIYEHRLVMEKKLGRFLLLTEIVDHIDELRLHNSEDNLRLFASNAEHLKSTITGQVPRWSAYAISKQTLSTSLRISSERVDTYNLMKKRGDARLRQILLAALSLGIESPYLLGSFHHLKKAGIFDWSHSSLERALEALHHAYA